MLNKTIKNQLKEEYKNLNIRRVEAIDNIVSSRGKDKGKAMIKAGYSKAYAKNPKQFLNTSTTKGLLNWIDYELEKIAKRMDQTRDQAKYKELSDSFVNLKKLKLLAGGNPTEILEISDKERQEVLDAFNNNTDNPIIEGETTDK